MKELEVIKKVTKIFLLLGVFAGVLFLANTLYKDMDVRDKQAYQKDYELFTELNYDATGLSMLDGDFYAVMRNYYDQYISYEFVTNKREYLEDKMHYYEESASYKGKVKAQLIAYVKNELQITKSDENITNPDTIFQKKMKLYTQRMKKLLPLYEKMQIFLDHRFVEGKSKVVTNGYYEKLRSAIEDLKQIREIQISYTEIPSLFYMFYGGGGKMIPLDAYESKILNTIKKNR